MAPQPLSSVHRRAYSTVMPVGWGELGLIFTCVSPTQVASNLLGVALSLAVPTPVELTPTILAVS